MVNVTMTAIDHPEFALALSYARPERRAGMIALFALDAALGQVLQTTREPMVGQMRLAWWREALLQLDRRPPPAEPVLQALAADVLVHGVTGAALAEMVDGWEPLFGDIHATALSEHAKRRGGVLFSQAAIILEASGGDPIAAAGQGWALVDLSAHLSDPTPANRAGELARPLLAEAAAHRWSRNARALGALAHAARMDLADRRGVGRVARLAWHRLTGR